MHLCVCISGESGGERQTDRQTKRQGEGEGGRNRGRESESDQYGGQRQKGNVMKTYRECCWCPFFTTFLRTLKALSHHSKTIDSLFFFWDQKLTMFFISGPVFHAVPIGDLPQSLACSAHLHFLWTCVLLWHQCSCCSIHAEMCCQPSLYIAM